MAGQGLAAVRAALADGGAPDWLAQPLLDCLGERAAQALHDDPWQILAVPGVRVEQADAFARALLPSGGSPADVRRANALVVWLLTRAALEGHTAVTAQALRASLSDFEVPDPEEALRAAVTDGRVLVFQEEDPELSVVRQRSARTSPEAVTEAPEPAVRVLLGLDRYALAEESLADGLQRLMSTLDPALPEVDWAHAVASVATPSAAQLVRTVADSALVLHMGGEAARAEPAALVASVTALGLRAWVVTATEDSRRRMATLLGGFTDAQHPEVTDQAGAASGGEPPRPAALGDGAAANAAGAEPSGGPAPNEAAGAEPAPARWGVVTMTALLSGRAGPGRQDDGSLALDVLVVCDAPQFDVEIAATLVESLPDGARLVFSGDPGTLWSAGPGRVFADLLAARACPTIASRTPDPGPLGELVSGVGVGELTAVDAPGREIVIVPVSEPAEAIHRAVQLVLESIPRAFGVLPEESQVITVAHGGPAGTRALNEAFKARLNPGPGQYAGFDPGDRVIYVPAPGRTVPAMLVSADAAGLHLDCAGSSVTVPREQVGKVRHGWAITAHQATGMRWPAVVVVLPGDVRTALTRQWVYTAFGRAERHLSVVHGAEQALTTAVAQVPAVQRTSRLRSILREQMPQEAH